MLEAGFTEMKFFPAEASGGAAYLKSLASPLPGGPLLPDRRHHRRERAVVPLPAQRRLRRRLVADPGRRARRRRLGPRRRAGPGGCRAGVLRLRVRAVDNQPDVRGVPEAPAPPAATAAPCRTPSRSTPTKVAHASTTSCLPALTASLAPPAGRRDRPAAPRRPAGRGAVRFRQRLRPRCQPRGRGRRARRRLGASPAATSGSGSRRCRRSSSQARGRQRRRRPRRRRRHPPAGPSRPPRPAAGPGRRGLGAVATKRQDGLGRAQFAAAAVDGASLTYRVKADGSSSPRALTSDTRQHRPLARRDVDRRVRRLAPRPRCGTTAAGSTPTAAAAPAPRATRARSASAAAPYD